MPYDDWKDPTTAQNWSADPTSITPTRTEHLDILLAILADHYQAGNAILDLGFGSGIVEDMIFQRILNVQIVGVDSSPAMMQIAAERLQPYAGQFSAVEHDLTQIKSLQLPAANYQFVISIQALHHLTESEMQTAYAYIYRTLQTGGFFILIDRIAIDKPGLFSIYRSVWHRLDHVSGAHVSKTEGATFDAHLNIVRERGDLPVSLEKHLRWLGEAGFEADCLHAHSNRALIVGYKKG